MQELPEGAFGRMDEMPDEEFYRTPRLVTHIDDRAIAAVTQLYGEFFPAGGEVLDLMSSWISHLPPEVGYRRVVGQLVPLDVPAGRQPHPELAVPVEQDPSVPHHEDRHREVPAVLPPVHSRRLHQPPPRARGRTHHRLW